MKKKECNNGIICPSTVNKLIDSNKDFIELNSNFPIRFKICDNISLPKNCKIEILETKLKYNISHIEKEILINGRSIESNSASLNDSINIGEDFINCPKSNINKILFSATEHLKLSICLTLIFKAIAHTDNYDRIYIESIGEYKDTIDTILLSKCCSPICKLEFNKTYIDLNNCLSATCSPDYIFLSPLFDCSSNIDGFLGNVFINYKLCLDMTCYEKIKKYFYNTFPKNYEKSHIKKTIKIGVASK